MNDPIPIGHAEPPAPPRAPAKLGAAGRKLWRSVTDAFELDAAELTTLEATCRTLDDLGRLEKALADAPVEVIGSTGQKRPNGLFAEVRASRLALVRLLQALDVGDAEQAGGGSARSNAGRRMARARWAGRRG
jgi:hypothetical protein